MYFCWTGIGIGFKKLPLLFAYGKLMTILGGSKKALWIFVIFMKGIDSCCGAVIKYTGFESFP